MGTLPQATSPIFLPIFSAETNAVLLFEEQLTTTSHYIFQLNLFISISSCILIFLTNKKPIYNLFDGPFIKQDKLIITKCARLMTTSQQASTNAHSLKTKKGLGLPQL